MTATNTPDRTRQTSTLPDTVRLGFGRLVRSEWIKLRSIRSTIWCYAVLAFVTIAMAVLVGAGSDSGSGIPQDLVNALTVSKSTTAVAFAALVVGVVGVLTISGEYTTGQIRSSFTADPRRVGVALAKAAVVGVVTFVVSTVATWIGVAVSVPLQATHGLHPDLTDWKVLAPILGSSVYLTLIALMALGIGLLVRSSAGGIAITLGLLLVLPGVLSLVGNVTKAQWVSNVVRFLPSESGSQLYQYAVAGTPAQQGVVLNGWSGFTVLFAEVIVVLALALAAARRRDV